MEAEEKKGYKDQRVGRYLELEKHGVGRISEEEEWSLVL